MSVTNVCHDAKVHNFAISTLQNSVFYRNTYIKYVKPQYSE